jgi:hypothetical protein
MILAKPPLTLVDKQMRASPPHSDDVAPGSTGLPPPRKLGEHGQALWDAITAEYRIEDAGGVEILTQACLAACRT